MLKKTVPGRSVKDWGGIDSIRINLKVSEVDSIR